MESKDSFVDFKKTLKSVVIDNVKFYVVECDILMDEEQLYSYFLKLNSSRKIQENKND